MIGGSIEAQATAVNPSTDPSIHPSIECGGWWCINAVQFDEALTLPLAFWVLIDRLLMG